MSDKYRHRNKLLHIIKNLTLKSVPTQKKVQAGIKKLENIEWPKFHDGQNIDEFIEHVEKTISSEIGLFPNAFMPLEPRHFTFGIFRARPVDNFNNMNLFAEHSYPPPHVTKIGRCNFPKYPVFYGSNNPITALVEAIQSGDFKGRKYCISSWEIIKSSDKFFLENFLHAPLHERNFFSQLADMQIAKLNQTFENKLTKNQELGLKEYFKFIDNQFIEDKSYSLSASLAHRRIYGKHNYCTDILIYPSVQTKLQGVNFAINPNFVDNHMKVKRFYILELDSYDSEKGLVKVTIHKYGEILKNTIFWKNLEDGDETYRKFMTEDFKGFIQSESKVYK
mgnify:CR=1 FL=1